MTRTTMKKDKRTTDSKKAIYYAEAMQMFVEGEMDVHAISKRIDVSRSALNRWCLDGRWMKLRDDFRKSSARAAVTAKMILLDIITKLDIKRAADDEEISAAEVDRMAKVAATVERLEGVSSPRRTYIAFASKFALWCRETYAHDEDFLARLSDAIQGYGSVILENG